MAENIYDPAFVKAVFDRCSDRYIAFSYLCSLGFTERWRRQCVAALGRLEADSSGYDLMAGTGEVWPHLPKANPDRAKITAVDRPPTHLARRAPNDAARRAPNDAARRMGVCHATGRASSPGSS